MPPMKRAALLVPLALLMSACSGGEAGNSAAPASTSAAATTERVTAVEYGEQWIAEYEDTFGSASAVTGGTGSTSDWVAFAQTIDGLVPPEGYEGEHNRAVVAFEYYAETRGEFDDTCSSNATSGECYGLASDLSQAWQDALNASYDLPGLGRPA